MIGADTLGRVGTGDDLIKHPAQGESIDRALVYGKSNDPAAPLVHDEQHPVGMQGDGLTTKQIDTPQTVFCMADERQPGGSSALIGVVCVVGCQHAPHHILVYLNAKDIGNYHGDAWTTVTGVALFDFDNGFNQCLGRPFGAGCGFSVGAKH